MTLQELMAEVNKMTDAEKQEFYKTIRPDVAKALNLVIRTQEEDTTHTNNQVAQRADILAEQNFNQKFKAQLDEIDARVEKHTGVKRKPTQANDQNEKTTDYIERAFTEYAGKVDSADGKMVQQLQTQLQTQAREYEAKLEAERTNTLNAEINGSINTAVRNRKVAIPAHITEADKQIGYANQALDSIWTGFRSKYTPKKTEQGIVWHLGDQPQLNTQDGKPLTEDQLIDRDYGNWFVPKGKEQPGGGTPPGGGGEGGSFRTKADIHAHLTKKGLDVFSPEYKTQLKELATKHKISLTSAEVPAAE